ncbi:MAG: flippase-like domain-containing protein [Proteobacteria bacterium]|nr:flippase-like domain-containing protein [Pseudomonadota bacterium]MBT5190564.1 flippase-like domain-containing protein [Pseudomonadota bacterium]MBT6658344.1 flippase-like domain-containing protein [Pseudomonadota bacterium]
MSDAKKMILMTLKLLIVAALFGIIFYNVNWIDTVTHTDLNGHTNKREGAVIGPWDQNQIQFQFKDTEQQVSIKTGVQANGSMLSVSPGLPTYVRNLDGPLFAAGAFLFFLFFLIINSRWWFLLRANGLNVRFLEAQKYGWIGLFFSNALPGATGGDVIKAVYIARHCSGDKVRAIVSIFVDRVIGLVSLLFVGFMASLMAMDRFPVFASTIWLTGIGVLFFCFLLVSPSLRKLIRFDAIVSWLPQKIGKLISELDQAILYYREHLQGIGLWILASPLIYTLFIGSFYLMSESLGVGISLKDLFFIVPVASVIQGIPIAPAGWGIGEAAYGALIGKFGAVSLPETVDAEQIMRTRGVALSILHRVHVVAWSLLGGLFVLLDRKREVENPPKTPQ